MKSTLRFALLSILTLVSTASLHGQTMAQLSGRVTDQTGGVVPEAQITVTNTRTGVQWRATASEAGEYVIPFLPAGTYTLSAEKTGFGRVLRDGLVLETGFTRTVDIALPVGAVAEQITVTTQSPLLEAESSSVGQLIERASIENMPIATRRASTLMRLAGNMAGTAVAGGRSLNNMFLLDGTTVQAPTFDNPELSLDPPAESLQEFKIEQNAYSAEYGRNLGGVVVMTTRSGTNTFHGSAYNFLRNDKLDTRTFFAPSLAPLRYNIFGASAGGPVIKNKTFFFFNYEGSRRRTGSTVSGEIVPHPIELTGDFSNRTDLTVIDPLTEQPFPGNRIPESRMDPIGRALASYYPAPNTGSFDITRRPSANFIAVASSKNDTDIYTTKIDHDFREQDRVYFRYIFERGVVFTPPINLENPFADRRGSDGLTWNSNATANWIHQYTPTLLNELRFNFGRQYFRRQSMGATSGISGQLGLHGVDPEAFPIIIVPGLSNLGAGSGRSTYPIDTYHFLNNVTWIRGSHFIKTGVEFRYGGQTNTNKDLAGGQFRFGERITGSGLAELLLGRAESAEIRSFEDISARIDNYGAFIQDDWKVSRNLTLNLGLRWEMDTPRWDKDNRMNSFDLKAINPVCNCPGVITFAGLDGRSKYAHDFDKNNFGPRFGFAWNAMNRMVIRGGYAVHYNGAYHSGIAGDIIAGFSNEASFSSPDGGRTPAVLLRNGMPAIPAGEPLTPAFGAVPIGESPRYSPAFIQQNHVNGYAHQWNFGVQRELPANMLFEVAYLGKAGHKLGGDEYNLNVIPLINGRGPEVQRQTGRPFPQFDNVQHKFPPWGNSIYHAMNAKLEKRFSHGLNFLMNYTFSKFLDDVEPKGELGGSGLDTGITHPELRYLDRAPSGNDIRHRYIASGVYELPFGKGRRWGIGNSVLNHIAGGWGLGVIAELRSGAPIGVIEQTNLTNTYSTNVRPNLLHDPELSRDRTRTEKLARWFDTTAFAAPAVGEFGNAARTIAGLGPGYFGLDASVNKTWSLTERYKLMYRADFYNAPNYPVFAAPNRSRGNGNFGRITGTSGTGRQIQMSLRFQF